MKLAYFDCIAGASGDMILGAMIDAGMPEDSLREQLATLRLDDFELTFRRVSKNGFSATKVDVLVADDIPARHLPDIKKIVQKSDLPEEIKAKAVEIFHRLGEVEAGIHGVTLDRVHLHELGGIDTIIDVVGTLVCLKTLEIEKVYSSPLPLGRGFVDGAHGKIPLPAPATSALLKGIPVVGSDQDAELVTPTGAVLISSLATAFGPLPAMAITATGYGAGSRDLTIPNVLRLFLGEGAKRNDTITEALVLIETNIDDLNPETYDYLMARLFEENALDVFLLPIQMKKNRPGTLLGVLCRPDDVEALMSILFAESGSVGIRTQTITRHSLPRSIENVDTSYGSVRIKVTTQNEKQVTAKPEYDDCRRLAKAHGATLREVYRAAEVAFDTMKRQ